MTQTSLDEVYENLLKIRLHSGRCIEFSKTLNKHVLTVLQEIYDDATWDIQPDLSPVATVLRPWVKRKNLVEISQWFRDNRPKITSVYNGRPIPEGSVEYENAKNHLMVTIDKISNL